MKGKIDGEDGECVAQGISEEGKAGSRLAIAVKA
jgi:hypothetical protein